MEAFSPPPPEQDAPGAPEVGKKPPQPAPQPRPAPSIISNTNVQPAFRPTSNNPAPPADNRPPSEQPVGEFVGRPKKRKKSRNVGMIVAIVVAVILLAGVGAFAYGRLHTGKPTAKKPTTTQQPAQTQQPTKSQSATPTDDSADTKTYSSNNFSLSLAYPSDWTPAETTAQLTISSPVMDLTDASGASVKGETVLTVRHKTAKPDEYKSGEAVAVLASEKVNYTAPTSTQRKSTYLSFLQYANTTVKGGLDGIYITGDAGYKYAQSVPEADIAKIDPLVDVVFMRCAASDQTTCALSGQTPLTISSSAWKDSSFKQSIVDMLTSLKFN